MIYILFKVRDKRVYQIILCTTTGVFHEELVPGHFFSRLNLNGSIHEIASEVVIDHFSAFEEITIEIADSKFYAVSNIENSNLILADKKNTLASKQVHNSKNKFVRS